jgi:hypothetical protein
MNRFKYFGSRPVFYFAEPAGGAGAGGGSAAAGGGAAASGAEGAGATAGGGTGGGGGAAAPAVSDEKFLEQAHPQQAEGTDAAKAAADKAAVDAKAAEGAKDEINLSALEPGQPEWLGNVTDPAAKAEIQKLLDYQKAVSARFKDQAELDAFFKDLPGGKEQVAALQLLSKEVGEIDGHIEANTPEGNALVAERYLSEAPDGGLGLFKAGAHHLASKNPEAYAQIGKEIANSTLKSAGIGADVDSVISAVNEMRAAVAKDDGEAFGKAAAKLLGEPKADAVSSADPRLTAAQEREKAARTAETKALGESWQSRDVKIGEGFKSHITSQVEKIFNEKVFTNAKSVTAEQRADLSGKIYAEILGQVVSNAYLRAQVTQLIGIANNGDLSKANLRATQAEFDKALDLLKGAANGDLINRAVAKVVSAFAKERAGTNAATREAAKGAAATSEKVGAAPAVRGGYKPITEDELKGKTDEEILTLYTERRGAYA